MAIKVRHDGNSATALAAGVGSGEMKQRIETAKFAQNTPQHIQTLQPAHASAPGAGGGSAPLIHAPAGASASGAPLTHAPAPTGGIGSRSALSRGGGAGGLGDEYKVTGTSIFDRPDKDSVWDPGNGGRWIRQWLPGEKEAEAAGRMNPVLAERAQIANASQRNLNEQRFGLDMDRIRLLNAGKDPTASSLAFPDAGITLQDLPEFDGLAKKAVASAMDRVNAGVVDSAVSPHGTGSSAIQGLIERLVSSRNLLDGFTGQGQPQAPAPAVGPVEQVQPKAPTGDTPAPSVVSAPAVSAASSWLRRPVGMDGGAVAADIGDNALDLYEKGFAEPLEGMYGMLLQNIA